MPLTRTPYIVSLNTGNVTWTNMPAALTELFGNVHRRNKIDLTDADRIRLVVRVSTVGATNAVLFAQYSTDESAWNTLTTNQVAINGSAATKASAWEDIPGAAKTDIFVRIVGQNGDGAADPVLGTICLHYR
jgi:hypothetical protein